MAAAVGAATTTAGKNIVCQVANNLFGCVVFGGTTTLADGVLATITFPAVSASLPLTKMAGSNVGAIPPAIPITSGQLLTLVPLSPCDINVDSRTDLLDVRAVVDQIEGVIVPATADLNADGKVDVLDVQIVVNAAQPGGVCRSGG
jgi:hypothetical protein